MATLEQVIEGLIAFRDTTYARLDAIAASLAAISGNLDTVIDRHSLSILCPSCDGSGRRMRSVDHGAGGMGPEIEEVDCPKCSGTGRKIWAQWE